MKNKVIISKDRSSEISYDEIRNSCMCVSIYALLQYFLLFDEQTIRKHTCYFTGYAVDKAISDKLPGYHFDVKQTINKTFVPSRWWDKFALRVTRNVRFPFIKNTNIYAQDLGFLSSLIGKQSYNMLSDAPNFLTMNMQPDSAEYLRHVRKNNSIQGKIERLLYGNVAVHTLGDNPQCTDIFLTEKNISPVLENKNIHINSFQELWQCSSESKKKFILDVFNVTDEDIASLQNMETMFLSQPLVQDGILKRDEYITILKGIFKHYDTSKMLVKPHPRDTFDYVHYFPGISVFKKKVNVQLLVLLGATLQRAVTICSSSINAFPNEVEADWFGQKCHPALVDFYGNDLKPFRPYNQMTL